MVVPNRIWELVSRATEKAKELPYIHRMWAIVVDKSGKILSESPNIPGKTHPRQAELAKRAGHPKRMHLHAEISAIIRAAKSGGDMNSILVIRAKRSGGLGMARPCSVCRIAIREAGISRVFYSDSNGNIVEDDVDKY